MESPSHLEESSHSITFRILDYTGSIFMVIETVTTQNSNKTLYRIECGGYQCYAEYGTIDSVLSGSFGLI
jgi:hypothetical protein